MPPKSRRTACLKGSLPGYNGRGFRIRRAGLPYFASAQLRRKKGARKKLMHPAGKFWLTNVQRCINNKMNKVITPEYAY
jgi:hypothetical protein